MIDSVSTAKFLDLLSAYPGSTVTRSEVESIASLAGLPFPRWYANVVNFRSGRGIYRKPTAAEVSKFGLGYAVPSGRGRPKGSKNGEHKVKAPKAPVVPPTLSAETQPMELITDAPAANTNIQDAASKAIGMSVIAASAESIPNIPAKLKGYVEWGNFETVAKVVESHHFLPIMITGPSGNGKTEMAEQVCANAQREFVRLNITNQTDEFDLLGGFRLENGDTKYALGPVPMAMLAGSVLLLDEIDLGGPALMCLQPVLEGKPLYLKKIGKYIHPKAGFTIIATANTKGHGDDGKYAHTNIMNEAMLERFAVMFEQGWPDASTERKILAYILKRENRWDSTLVDHLVKFANATRKSFEEQICNDQIATRRLIHIIRTFCTLGDINQVMALTLARFDADVAKSFMTLWRSIHDVEVPSPSGAPVATPGPAQNVPF